MPKRGTDHTWQLVKYKGDMAIYARCKCKYHYGCSMIKRKEDGSWSEELSVLYNYCPNCGARKKWCIDEIKRIDKYEFDDF